MHFFEEDCRAEQEAQALEQGDFAAFLALVDQSGLSSALNLQNTWSAAAPQQQAIPVALAVGRELLGGSGAIPGPRRRICRYHPGLCPQREAGDLPAGNGGAAGSGDVPHPAHPAPGRLCGFEVTSGGTAE